MSIIYYNIVDIYYKLQLYEFECAKAEYIPLVSELDHALCMVELTQVVDLIEWYNI